MNFNWYATQTEQKYPHSTETDSLQFKILKNDVPNFFLSSSIIAHLLVIIISIRSWLLYLLFQNIINFPPVNKKLEYFQ